MFLTFLILSLVGTYLALRKVAGDALSMYNTICTTLILAPALCFAVIWLMERVAGHGMGLGGMFVIVLIGLPLAISGFMALVIRAIVAWVHKCLPTPPVQKVRLCSHCGHPASEHRMATVGATLPTCFVKGCTCTHVPAGTDHAP
jgi:hypothetical protein